MELSLVRRSVDGAIAIRLVLTATNSAEAENLAACSGHDVKVLRFVEQSRYGQVQRLLAAGETGAANDLTVSGMALGLGDRGLDPIPLPEAPRPMQFQWVGVVPETPLCTLLLDELECRGGWAVDEACRLVDHLAIEQSFHLTELPAIPADLFEYSVDTHRIGESVLCSASAPFGCAD